ncbi:hypothetical protein PVT71_17560 [Salipiger sp. H15]|uniref:Uncharacterized protein n=1 Tax=Alloyangia sp. H15 TaxID=3029062 RepID=A0AAU8APQ4_9RHOB
MAEVLELPCTTIVIDAIFPALLHSLGLFTLVHLMVRKQGLEGLPKGALPKLRAVWSASLPCRSRAGGADCWRWLGWSSSPRRSPPTWRRWRSARRRSPCATSGYG